MSEISELENPDIIKDYLEPIPGNSPVGTDATNDEEYFNFFEFIGISFNHANLNENYFKNSKDDNNNNNNDDALYNSDNNNLIDFIIAIIFQ